MECPNAAEPDRRTIFPHQVCSTPPQSHSDPACTCPTECPNIACQACRPSVPPLIFLADNTTGIASSALLGSHLVPRHKVWKLHLIPHKHCRAMLRCGLFAQAAGASAAALSGRSRGSAQAHQPQEIYLAVQEGRRMVARQRAPQPPPPAPCPVTPFQHARQGCVHVSAAVPSPQNSCLCREMLTTHTRLALLPV